VQCDDIWSFVGGKDKNLPEEKKNAGLGSVWTWTAIDADTKLIASWLVGSRDAASAEPHDAHVDAPVDAPKLTNAFSKKVENHAAAVALYFMYYNFGRVHQTLRGTPAMEAGVASHAWSVEELVGLLG
jgi:hypothetical protein